MKRIRKLYWWLYFCMLIVISLAIVQCDSESNILYGSYPVEIGSSWLYRLSMPNVTVEDGVAIIDTFEVYYWLVADTMRVVSDSILATGIAVVNDSTGHIYGRDYIANLNDGVYRVGYDGVGIGIPGRNNYTPSIFPGFEPNFPTEKTWFAKTTSDYRLLMPYHSESGHQWSYDTDDNSSGVVNKIIGQSIIEVPYENLSCVHKTKTIFFDDRYIEPIHYYYAPCGVALLWADFGVTEVTDSLGVGPVAEYRMWEKIELIDYRPGR